MYFSCGVLCVCVCVVCVVCVCIYNMCEYLFGKNEF